MPTTSLPDSLTKVSYILPKSDKPKLEDAARRAGVSMSEIITRALRRYFAPRDRKKG